MITATPRKRGRKIHGGLENFVIFDSHHRLSRKRYEIGPWLWNVIGVGSIRVGSDDFE